MSNRNADMIIAYLPFMNPLTVEHIYNDLKLAIENREDGAIRRVAENLFSLQDQSIAHRMDSQGVREEIRILVEQMKAGFAGMEKRFEAADKRFEELVHYMDKRFEAIDKRFDEMARQTDKRFEAMDKRFDEMARQSDRRFEEMAKQSDRRFADLIHYTDKRFDDIQKSIRFHFTVLTIIISVIGLSMLVFRLFDGS